MSPSAGENTSAWLAPRSCGEKRLRKTICNFQKLQKNLVSAHFHCKFISELQKQKKHSGGKTGSALRETDSEIVSSIAYEERQNMNTPEDSYISLILNNYHKNILWFNTGIFLNYRAACSKIRLYFTLWYWLCLCWLFIQDIFLWIGRQKGFFLLGLMKIMRFLY